MLSNAITIKSDARKAYKVNFDKPVDHDQNWIVHNDKLTCGQFEPTQKEITIKSDEIVILVFATTDKPKPQEESKDLSCHGGSVLAYASACRFDNETGRPIMGFIGICPISLETSTESQIDTQRHELLHAIAFNTNYKFPGTQRFPLSRKYTFREPRPWKTQHGWMTNEVVLLETPLALAEARKHFNCPTMEGMELETQGGSGTVGGHWETRMFGNEAMIGGAIKDQHVMSRISLALIESTGWFNVNYSAAQPYYYGKNRGCDFLRQSCLEYVENIQTDETLTEYAKWQKMKPYCKVDYATDSIQPQRFYDCSLDRKSIDNCIVYDRNPQKDEPIPFKYQYFKSKLFGGTDSADFCPILTGGSQKPCSTAPKTDAPEFGQIYGEHSRCLDLSGSGTGSASYTVSLKYKDGTEATVLGRGGCYQTKCEDSKLHFKTANADEWFTCEEAGQNFTLPGTESSTIYCPSCWEICDDECGPGTNFAFDEVTSTQVTIPDDDDDDSSEESIGVRVGPCLTGVLLALIL